MEDAPDNGRGFDTKVTLTYTFKDEMRTIEGFGNGPIDAIKQGLNNQDVYNTRLTMYEEHALTTGSDSQAATYIELMNIDTGEKAFGVGISSNINRSSARAIFSALNRLYHRKHS
jgi:2-isopropylmalate synthase